MKISDFVNGLADNPDSNIVHADEMGGGTYEVTIHEISTHVYRVEADDDAEALVIARNRYEDGDEGDQEGIASDIHSTEVRQVDWQSS